MKDTSNVYCRQIVELLQAHGVDVAYCSPGSRNAPLLLAVDACDGIAKRVVVDERSAAFQAYGCALLRKSPVALICTSGTAVLDYAPAVAEAYYSGIALIIISADRPWEWIDQDDSQTIRQFGILDNIVKGSYDIRAIPEGSGREFTKEMQWYVNRTINEAILKAMEGKPGPVHINVQLSEPLGELSDRVAIPQRSVGIVGPMEALPQSAIKELANLAGGSNIMLVAGFCPPDHRLDQAVRMLASYPNVVVMAETIANLHDPQPLSTMIDAVLCDMDVLQRETMKPDIVISFGGALVSRMLKQYLRDFPPRYHWSIGHSNYFCDCFKTLTHRIDISPANFIRQLCGVIKKSGVKIESGYSRSWLEMRSSALIRSRKYIESSPWSDLKALDYLFSNMRLDNIFVSNGTVVRYSQLIPHHSHAEYCNRGVSGIDGSTSTAVGGAWTYNGQTTLISGDMSWLYDSGASALGDVPFTMRMVVINNSGGGIFRFIGSTSRLPERILDTYFNCRDLPDIASIAVAYGIEVKEASNMKQLEDAVRWLDGRSDCPRLLVVNTPVEESAEVLKGYFDKKS